MEEVRRQGYDIAGRRFSADRGYDSDRNCGVILEAGLVPNIRERENAVSRGKPGRKKAAEMYDPDGYKLRGMIEGIFGAEEAKRHQLHCRFIREDNQQRWGKGRAIGWNIPAPGALQGRPQPRHPDTVLHQIT